MKKMLLTWAVLLSCVFAIAQDLQRIGFPPQQISLAAGKGKVNAAPVKSYCVDVNRYSRFDGTDDYSIVAMDALCVIIGNAAPITLQQALDLRKISMKVNHYNKVVFTNLTNQPVKINIPKIVILGKSVDDTEGLLIPSNFGSGSRTPQDRIWMTQSLVHMGFLSESSINDAAAINRAKQAYFSSMWVKDLASPEFRQKIASRKLTDKELSDQLKEQEPLLQYALALKQVSPNERAAIELYQLEGVEDVWLLARTLRVVQPMSKYWKPTYVLHTDEAGMMHLFDDRFRLLIATTDEREIASSILNTRGKPKQIQIAGYGEMSPKQGDAVAANIELRLNANQENHHVYYTDLGAKHDNFYLMEDLLSDDAQNKVNEMLSTDNIVQAEDISSVDVTFLTTGTRGNSFETVVSVSSNNRGAISDFISWVNGKYQHFTQGSLYASIQKYCLPKRLRSYVKSMLPYFRMSDIRQLPSITDLVTIRIQRHE